MRFFNCFEREGEVRDDLCGGRLIYDEFARRAARTNHGFVRSGRCDCSSCKQKLPAINNKTIRVIRGNGFPAFPPFFPSSPLRSFLPTPRVRARRVEEPRARPSNVCGNYVSPRIHRLDQIKFGSAYYRIQPLPSSLVNKQTNERTNKYQRDQSNDNGAITKASQILRYQSMIIFSANGKGSPSPLSTPRYDREPRRRRR